MKFNDEELKILSKYDNNFRTAINAQYTRNIPSKELQELEKIYKRVADNNYNLCLHCSTQILVFITKLGKLYFEDLKIKEQKEIKGNGKKNKRKSQ